MKQSTNNNIKRALGWALAGAGATALPAWTQQENVLELSPVVVTATRTEERSFDIPASIDSIDQSRIQNAQPQVNLSETLVTVPGVVANNRQNYAQDLQISIRGFGARSTFGVRGIRLFADGIPATMPDGQGQVSNFDLSSAERVEVLRGPFSALYGNSSGGVIQIFTADGPEAETASPSFQYGSFDTWRAGLKFGGDTGPINYVFDASHFETDGYRDHSGARRELLNNKVRFDVNADASLTVIANYVDTPEAQDPLGLTRAQLEQNPEQAGTNAIAFNTRKSFTNLQGGLVYEHRLGSEDTIRVMGYTGDRQVTQFLALAPAAQIPATSSGGVIDLDRQFRGIDARWIRRATLAGEPLTFSLGLNYDYMQERRQGFNNFTGPAAAPTAIGVFGNLRRNEDNHVFNFDQYVQAEWEFARQWAVSAGLRHSRVAFESRDSFLSNGDDSGDVTYSNTSPVAGLLFKATPALNLYANFGKGFETPTFNELSYQLNAQGLNFALRPARSKNYELGAKALIGAHTRLNAALFKIDTDDEIVVLQNRQGRSVFQNVDETSRHGFELGVDTRFGEGFSALAAYTFLDATFESSFQTCTTTLPCIFSPPTNLATVPAGNYLPGIPKHQFYGEVGWSTPNQSIATAIELRAVDKIYTNDLNSEFADSYVAVNWRIGFQQQRGKLTLREFVRVDNIFNQEYVGSVIVNEANGRYYEPASGTAFTLGVSLAYQF